MSHKLRKMFLITSLNTVTNVKGITKNNVEMMADLAMYYRHRELEWNVPTEKYPKTFYFLDKT